MKRFALTLLLLPSVAFGQSVTLKDVTTGKPGHWIVLTPLKVDGGPLKWRLDPALEEVDVSGVFENAKSRGKIVTADQPGRYKYEAWNAKGDVASDIAVGWVVILGPTPPPIPPTPIPPDPKPVPPPPSPAPFPLPGFRVVVVFDQDGGTALLTKQQYNELYGQEVATYLNAKCAKSANGNPEWRIYRKKTDMSNAPKAWQDVMVRPRGSLPWVIISDGVSSAGSFEGPLPDGGFINLLRKYGG